jgi:hypothetical protein
LNEQDRSDFSDAFDELKDELSYAVKDHGFDAAFRALITLTAILALELYEDHAEASKAMTEIFSEESLARLVSLTSIKRMS